tara:strand:+ start:30495 stop:30905 length:411 start_codon:yes stop_codon:yes gene_type:complete
MSDYEKLLEKARKEVPKKVLEVSRFEIIKVKGHFQGNKTIINNFYQISDNFHRDPKHLMKFILKELATPGELTKSALILGSKVPSARINEKINKYAKEFVICKECNKPETKLINNGNITTLRCLACGAHHPIKSKI